MFVQKTIQKEADLLFNKTFDHLQSFLERSKMLKFMREESYR
jgi:hypothetical protein